MIYENLIRLQVINSPAVGNGPRVLLVFPKVNMLKNEDIRFRWSQEAGQDETRSKYHEVTQAVSINIREKYWRSRSCVLLK